MLQSVVLRIHRNVFSSNQTPLCSEPICFYRFQFSDRFKKPISLKVLAHFFNRLGMKSSRTWWMTGQALRNNYLHKIPSPFPFCEGQRERKGEKWQKVKYAEKALVFLLGLAYEELYTWWSTGLMGGDTHTEKHTHAHVHKPPHSLLYG